MDTSKNTSMKRKKVIRVNSGTDIIIGSPTHPLSVVMQIERTVSRVLNHKENEFEFSCNTLEGLDLFNHLGTIHYSRLDVEFYLNGTKSTYEESVSDLKRGVEYVKRIIADKI